MSGGAVSMSNLIVRPQPAPDGKGEWLSLTPESVGWKYVHFEVRPLPAGQTFHTETGNLEVCIVILSGKVRAYTKGFETPVIGERKTVFERIPPYSLYLTTDEVCRIEAVENAELAICKAPGKGTYPSRVIRPEDVKTETRGHGAMERYIQNILADTDAADSLLVVEVYTPNGNWSSYPPHKHDEDNLPHEAYLEETYYHRINPPHGFCIQRVYDEERGFDETVVVRNGEVVLVPRGYHMVGAPPGYDLYYLNVMAGPTRTWVFQRDEKHTWIK
jgi:5-deoxy-glucuronate isomerase